MRFDDRGEALEHTIHDGVDVLGIELPAEPRGLHNVREENRHRLELLLGSAEPVEPGAQGGERRVDHRVAEDGALRLQGGDGAFELFALRHPVAPGAR